jgi:RNA polymerase sigma-70 factor (ECF subfamily)
MRPPHAPHAPRELGQREALTEVAAVQPTAAQRSSAPDTQIAWHCERANFGGAARLILRQFAHEVRAFLRARTRNRESMEEVYAIFSADVWKGLPQFRFEGPVRSWLYVLARHALSRHAKSRQRWRSRHLSAELDEIQADEVRSSIAAPASDLGRLEPLLQGLSLADRKLLEQRLVLSLAWREIAMQHARASDASDEAELTRESARLRKRYQILIQKLRARVAGRRDSSCA